MYFTTRYNKLFRRFEALILVGITMSTLAGCKNGDGADSDECEALIEERAKVMETLTKLEGVLEAMPTDAVRYSQQTETELMRFSQLYVELNDQIEAMHDAHEVACKWPMIEKGDFDGVFETIYRPHVEVLGRQRRAVLDVANALEKAGPEDVVGGAVTAYRDVAKQLRDGLAMQLQVCEKDFDPETCAPFKDAIRAAVNSEQVAAVHNQDSSEDEQETKE